MRTHLTQSLEAEYKRPDGYTTYQTDQKKLDQEIRVTEEKLRRLNPHDDVEEELFDIYERVREDLEAMKQNSRDAAEDAGIL